MSERTDAPFAVTAAKLSVYLPLMGILVNLSSRGLGAWRGTPVVIGAMALLAYLTGFVFAIVALVGMRTHGRAGILTRAVLGLIFNGLILLAAAIAVPTMMKSRERVLEKAAEIRTVIEAPPGFNEFPQGMGGEDVTHSFISGDPTDEQPDVVILIEDMGGRIAKEDFAPLMNGRTDVRILDGSWQGHPIQIVEVTEVIEGVTTLTYNAQIPLIPRAIQLRVVGIKETEPRLQETIRQMLLQVKGPTNW